MTIYIAPSVHRSLDVRTAVALQAAMHASPTQERVIWEPLWGDALIARSRSMQATKWLDVLTDADVMVMIDDDIVDRKSTRLNSSHVSESRMPSSA